MVIVLILFFSKKRVKNVETSIFSVISIVNIIGIILDLIIVYLSYVVPFHPSLYILNKFYLIYILYWSALFTIYVAYISLDDKKHILNMILYIITTISIAATIFIFILPIELINDLVIMYTDGPSVRLLYVVCVVFIIFIIVIALANFKRISAKKYVPIYALSLFGVVAFIARSINPAILLTTSIMTVINVLMYHTIENPDIKLLREMSLAREQAEKANRAKSEFLSSMSHEIRTPLNAIVGFSEDIMHETDLEIIKSEAKDIVAASNILLDIVNGVLDISKIEANKMELVETKYIIRNEIENLSNLITTRLKEKPIEFEVRVAEDVPYKLYGDNGKIKQIVTNFLTNAVKYTEQGKIIFDIKSINEKDYATLVITVSDTGRGIKQEDLSKLFKKFERIDEDRNTTIEGTGLGLVIAKSLTEILGGKIVVQSTYGKGSTFIVYIKQRIIIKEVPVSMTQREEETNELLFNNNWNNKKILLVDDNLLNLKVATRIIGKYGLQVDTCESGFECLNKIKSNIEYDVIFLDVMMPKMDGVETLNKLKQIPNFNIPVIALTADAIEGMKEKYLKDGFDDYLPKPIVKEDLEKVLIKYLN